MGVSGESGQARNETTKRPNRSSGPALKRGKRRRTRGEFGQGQEGGGGDDLHFRFGGEGVPLGWGGVGDGGDDRVREEVLPFL